MYVGYYGTARALYVMQYSKHELPTEMSRPERID
jgi:hypothetical protein